MRVVFGLQGANLYADRIRMLARLSKHVECVWLLTDADPDIDGLRTHYPGLRVIILPRKGFSANALQWLIGHEDQFDIVHDAMGCFASYFQSRGPIPGRRIRLISTLYTNNWAWFSRARARWMDFGFSYVGQRIKTLWRDRRISTNADRMLVLGPGHEEDLVAAHNVPLQQITWIPSEVNMDRFYPIERLESVRRTILFTGVICRNKGIDTLLSAAQLLNHRGVDFELRLIGRLLFWERAWFQRACAEAELGTRLHLTGNLGYEALLDEYQTADIFAFPSRFEGSPRSVREAVACRTAAVVSEIPGHRGIDPEGDFLRFVPSHEPADWADALEAALSEGDTGYHKRLDRGVEHMESHHSLDAVAQNISEIYRSVAASPPRGG